MVERRARGAPRRPGASPAWSPRTGTAPCRSRGRRTDRSPCRPSCRRPSPRAAGRPSRRSTTRSGRSAGPFPRPSFDRWWSIQITSPAFETAWPSEPSRSNEAQSHVTITAGAFGNAFAGTSRSAPGSHDAQRGASSGSFGNDADRARRPGPRGSWPGRASSRARRRRGSRDTRAPRRRPRRGPRPPARSPACSLALLAVQLGDQVLDPLGLLVASCPPRTRARAGTSYAPDARAPPAGAARADRRAARVAARSLSDPRHV